MRSAVVKFYFDADVLGLAKAISRLRNECTYPGDPGAIVQGRQRAPCPITSPATKDPEWIPVVAQAGWITITRDSRIGRRPWESRVLMEHGARHVTISGYEGTGTWKQLEIVMRHWRRIEALTEEPGPFIYTATYRRFSRLTPVSSTGG